MLRNDDYESKVVRLKEHTKKTVDKFLAEAKKEGWGLLIPPGYALSAGGFYYNQAIEIGLVELTRRRDWQKQKEKFEQIGKEIATPMPPLDNKKAADLRHELEEIENQKQALQQRKKTLTTKLEPIVARCEHEWKYSGINQFWPVQTCKHCGTTRTDVNTILQGA